MREFLSYANPDAIRERQSRNHLVLLASQNQSVVGVLELRDYDHISLLFVVESHQRIGIGRLLVREALNLIEAHHQKSRIVSVNSSPNAVEAYKKFGFTTTGHMHVKNGIAFVPMVLSRDSNNGV